MIYELNHLGIVTDDLDRSVAFYVDLLGAQPVWSAEVAAAGMRIAYLQLAQGLVELIEFAAGTAPAGANHLGYLSDDLDGDVDRLRDAGATVTVEPRATGSGVGRQALVLDPDGVAIELLQRDLPLRSGTTPHPHIHAIDHFALQADDHDRSLAFYRDGLGMAVAR
ncbi:catechol 2,3-dioxygenase-like lactoylglutathione lyase family enzyme [Schumannella luteola]|uniref:Catechol 2,3-dioxygenase-like lactoylglutathione lyase family enzyme n=1 Tax=Schumannella luteola TaxID=472059 RepID=A0A852YDF8_9MICO|nr:catechol 2,3-dioxygenase-like lactoylglutathione lyase family enzyme [Schumannella luteola]